MFLPALSSLLFSVANFNKVTHKNLCHAAEVFMYVVYAILSNPEPSPVITSPLLSFRAQAKNLSGGTSQDSSLHSDCAVLRAV